VIFIIITPANQAFFVQCRVWLFSRFASHPVAPGAEMLQISVFTFESFNRLI
jgi:hypothetical protein